MNNVKLMLRRHRQVQQHFQVVFTTSNPWRDKEMIDTNIEIYSAR